MSDSDQEIRQRKGFKTRSRSSADLNQLVSEAVKEEAEDTAHHKRKRKRHRSLSPSRHYHGDISGLFIDQANASGEEDGRPIHEVRGHSFLVHVRHSASPLAPESPEQNYRGLFNLAGLVLFVTNFRLVVENLLKYGWLMNFNGDLWRLWQGDVCMLCLLAMGGLVLVTFLLEKYAALLVYKRIQQQRGAAKGTLQTVPEIFIAYAHGINITSAVVFPIVVTEVLSLDPISAIILVGSSLVVMMKLVSWVLVNKEVRADRVAGKIRRTEKFSSRGCTYPDNVTLKNFFYFLAVPTLCYQLEYPRTPHIRWMRAGNLFVRWLFCSLLMLFMAEQYIVPILINSLESLDQMHFGRLLERILKLSIPNMYIWLLMFYSFFHLYLNLLAEVLRFGDREFYKDWWNSTTLSEYWRTWNLPVHNWLLRHVYYPLRRAGCSQVQCGFIIFFLSGVGHEVLVSVPCHTYQPWVLISFILQLPLIWVTRTYMKGTKWGNVLFWFSFCMLGQPLFILLYTHLAYKEYSFLFFK